MTINDRCQCPQRRFSMAADFKSWLRMKPHFLIEGSKSLVNTLHHGERSNPRNNLQHLPSQARDLPIPFEDGLRRCMCRKQHRVHNGILLYNKGLEKLYAHGQLRQRILCVIQNGNHLKIATSWTPQTKFFTNLSICLATL